MAKAVRTNNSFMIFMSKEQKRLERSREDALSRKAQADKEVQRIERELQALDAYQVARTGRSPPKAGRKVRLKMTGRGEKRERVLKIIQRNPDGLSRGEILRRLSLKGNKVGEQSVSNILTALKKIKRVSNRNGKYVAV